MPSCAPAVRDGHAALASIRPRAPTQAPILRVRCNDCKHDWESQTKHVPSMQTWLQAAVGCYFRAVQSLCAFSQSCLGLRAGADMGPTRRLYTLLHVTMALVSFRCTPCRHRYRLSSNPRTQSKSPSRGNASASAGCRSGCHQAAPQGAS